jgi:hypothetical protein
MQSDRPKQPSIIRLAQTSREGNNVKATPEHCAYTLCDVRQAVNRAVDGTWDTPSFQRSFIWNPLGVRDLAESLWRDYPIGPVLLWERPADGNNRQYPFFFVVDGQHRLTSLCVLFGKRPLWWSGDRRKRWNEIFSRHEVWFDAHAQSTPYFRTATDPVVDRSNPRFVALPRLLSLNLSISSAHQDLKRLASEIDTANGPHLETEKIYARLIEVCAISDKTMMAIVLRNRHLEDVLEIFARLNGQGIRFRRLLLSAVMRTARGLWTQADRAGNRAR